MWRNGSGKQRRKRNANGMATSKIISLAYQSGGIVVKNISTAAWRVNISSGKIMAKKRRRKKISGNQYGML